MRDDEVITDLEELEGSAKRFALRLLNALRDDLRVSALLTLFHEDMLSFRALSRRLRVNNKRLRNNLRPLLEEGLIEEIQIRVADGRVYRAYRLTNGVRSILKALYEAGMSSKADEDAEPLSRYTRKVEQRAGPAARRQRSS